jgi:diguanylate cyclase (GGDEF)-like protein
MGNPEHLLRVTLQSIRDAVVTTDREARVLALNPAAEAMTGWSSTEAAGKLIEEVIALSELHSREKHVREASDRDGLCPAESSLSPLNPAYIALRDRVPVANTGELLLSGKDGRRTAVHLIASPVHDFDGQIEGCVLALHDVSEAVQMAERISYLAQHDPLTGLPNRILFVDRLEQGTKLADRNGDDLAVFFLDLDNFSQIKSTYGYGSGDAVLKEASYRMVAALRESDSVCRLGGDEFVLLVTGVKSLTDVEAVAAKLVEELAKPFALDAHTIQTSSSIGVSIYPRDGSDADTLLRLADGAMRQAKREGRNRYLFARPEAERAG